MSELHFNAEMHEYTLDGKRVPGVTEILRATGVSMNYEALMGNGPSRAAIELARAIGIAVHSDAHAYDDGDLDLEAVDPRVRPYVDAWIAFRENHSLVPLIRERRVYHPTFGYAGTMDGLFAKAQHTRGPHVLIDIKTGDVEASACRYQTAAYLGAFLYEHKDWPAGIDRMAVQLVPDRKKVPYRLTLYPRDHYLRDLRKFTCFLTTYQEQFVRRAA